MTTPPSNSRIVQLGCAFGAIVALSTLGLQASKWHRTGVVEWPSVLNTTGLLILLLVIGFAPPNGQLLKVGRVTALVFVITAAVLLIATHPW
jgi:hypothetical protein